MDSRGMKQEGPRLVVRAWTDDAFKQRLLQVGVGGECGDRGCRFAPHQHTASDQQVVHRHDW